MIRRMVFSRILYFEGRLLTASDFQAEQDYLRDKQRFRNLHTYGVGIVSGSSVKTQQGNATVLISPGYAIDALGREICMSETMECPLPQDGERLFVCLTYVECEADPILMSSIETGLAGAKTVYARLEEGVEVMLEVTRPSTNSSTLPVALLRRKRTRWTRDPSFRPPRAKWLGAP